MIIISQFIDSSETPPGLFWLSELSSEEKTTPREAKLVFPISNGGIESDATTLETVWQFYIRPNKDL